MPVGTIWENLPKLPVEEAACTSFLNTLLIVGGRANKDPVRDIRTYNPVENLWQVIGYLKILAISALLSDLMIDLLLLEEEWNQQIQRTPWKYSTNM